MKISEQEELSLTYDEAKALLLEDVDMCLVHLRARVPVTMYVPDTSGSNWDVLKQTGGYVTTMHCPECNGIFASPLHVPALRERLRAAWRLP